MDQHSFNLRIASKYGVNCAVILQNLLFWTEHNKANNTHFHDGYYWTYNSNQAFAKQFQYITPKQIRYALEKLKAEGLILTARYKEDNIDSRDRTLWYAVTQKAIDLMNGKEEADEFTIETEDISDFNAKLKEEMEHEEDSFSFNESKLANAFAKIDHMHLPIRANDSDNIPQIKTPDIIEKEIHKEKEATEDPVVSVFDFWNSKNLLKCEELTPSLRNIINSTLKSNKLDEIKLYISRYDEVLNNQAFYLEHKWSLKSFICQPNAMNDFRDNGEKWLNYVSWKNKSKDTSKDQFIHNQYTREEMDSLISNLDEVAV